MTMRSVAPLIGLALACVSPVQADEPKKGGTLTYAYHPEPTALSAVATTALPTQILSSKIAESLLEYEGPELKPLPGLAESWTVAPDGLTYTFKLRSGVRWHDGAPFTSADVKFTVEKIILPTHVRGATWFGQVRSIETPNPLTVVFHLKQPVPFFLQAFQPTETPLMPMHVLAKTDLSKIATSAFMQHPIGTGPFYLKEWKKGSHIILERYPNYWKKGHPFLDRIVLRVIPDDNARLVALQSREIDLAPADTIPHSALSVVAKDPDLVISKEGAEALAPVAHMMVNLRHKPLNDLRVRRAISMAINRDTVVNVMFFGQGRPATNPISHDNVVFYNKELQPYPFDPAGARKLLDEAGYPAGADGTRFTLNLDPLPYSAEWIRLGEYLRLALKNVGIQVNLRNQDFAHWVQQTYGTWNFDLATGFLYNYSDPSVVLEQAYVTSAIQKGGAFNNIEGYSNPKFDDIVARAHAELDIKKRRQLYFEAERIMHDDLPVIFLFEPYTVTVWNKKVHGLITNGISLFSTWDSVWMD